MFAYTGYLDESADDDHTLMGGVIARADHWKQFDQRFAELQWRHRFKVFHTKEFKKKTGNFKGWSNEQCLALIADLGALTNTLRNDSIVMVLNNNLYDTVYKKPGEKGAFLSKYGLCFHACLLHFVKETIKHKYRKKIPFLDLVLESGHKNAGAAEAIVTDMKRHLAESNMLRHVVLADKDHCGQLMMGDFLSHMELLKERKVQAGTHVRTSAAMPKGMSAIVTSKMTEEFLSVMRERALNKNLRHAPASAFAKKKPA